MKKLIIVLVLLLVLGGGGAAAAWWFYFRTPEDAVEAPPPIQLSQTELDSIPVTVLRNGKTAYLFNFRIVLMFDDPLKKELVDGQLPAVYDAIATELHQLMSRKQLEQGGFEEALIRQRLEKVVKKRIGTDNIYRVSIRAMEKFDLK
jgi:flagellar basal body-associated protein FliL